MLSSLCHYFHLHYLRFLPIFFGFRSSLRYFIFRCQRHAIIFSFFVIISMPAFHSLKVSAINIDDATIFVRFRLSCFHGFITNLIIPVHPIRRRRHFSADYPPCRRRPLVSLFSLKFLSLFTLA